MLQVLARIRAYIVGKLADYDLRTRKIGELSDDAIQDIIDNGLSAEDKAIIDARIQAKLDELEGQ